MKYIKVLIFILIPIIFTFCQNNKEGDCEGDKCVPQCSSDKECIERSGDENSYCYKTQHEAYCRESACKKLNIDCGKGECKGIYDGYYCECEKDTMLVDNNNGQGSYCVDNYCESSKDCLWVRDPNKENGGINIFMRVCSKNNKCIEICNNDKDCIGNDEFCVKRSSEYICLSLKEEKSDSNCDTHQYLDIYNRDQNGELICSELCDDNADCGESFICNGENHCVPKCETNQDCIDDKFSNGNICDTSLNYCVKELSKTADTEKAVGESFINELGIENCEIPESNFFDKTCDDFHINSEKGREFGKYITYISIVNENYDYDNHRFRVNSVEEYNRLIDLAKKKSRAFLNKTVKDYNFTLYNAGIYDGWFDWSLEHNEVDHIEIDYKRTWGGIEVLGADARFTFDINIDYITLKLAFLKLEKKEYDADLITQLEAENQQIEQYLVQYAPDKELSSKFGYFVFENDLELVFLLQVENGYYLLKRSNYDGSYESVEHAVTPQTPNPCEPNPCNVEPHQTVCKAVDGGMNYYCDCEDGYIENANGQTPICIVEE